jgi:hypothetical protein
MCDRSGQRVREKHRPYGLLNHAYITYLLDRTDGLLPTWLKQGIARLVRVVFAAMNWHAFC